MANWSKLHAFLGFFPEVQPADQLLPHRQKVIYTTISLFIFLAASQLPLYGIQLQSDTRPDPLYWGRLFFASNSNTIFTLGIGPILLSEIMMQILVASKSINVDSNAPEAHTFMNRAQKLIGMLITILGAVTYVLDRAAVGKFGTGNAVLILLQIFLSGIVVIYLDDVLKKGYGLLSSISLFTATNICGNVLWKAFSPMVFIYHEHGAEFEGAVPAWVHLLITRTDKLSATREAFYRQNLPNVINLLATCLFVLIAIFFQGLSILLPVRKHDIPGLQVNCLIKISNIFHGPIILHRLLVLNLYVISKLLYMKYGGNKLVNLLGTWNGSNHFEQSFPVGGIVYYLTATPTLADLHRNPFHTFIYVIFVLGACALLSEFWLRVCASSKRFRDRLIVLNEEQSVMLAQPDSIPWNEFGSHVVKAARFGGFCLGALIILGDLISVLGSGSGIMLAVTALYPYFEGRAGEVGAFGF
uniref:Pco109407 n=1 Tax=Arundo donax TaxID=35708 RepID=A0A0A9EGM5_ARUDO